MDKMFKPLFDHVVKVINGEDPCIVNTGIPEAFEKVSKELIGYNCFSRTVHKALVYHLERCIGFMRKQGIVSEKLSFVGNGDVNSDIDIAIDLAQTIIPQVLQSSFEDRHGRTEVINELYAFVHFKERDLEAIFEVLGKKFQEIYEERFFYRPKEGNTEELYEAIVNIATEPF